MAFIKHGDDGKILNVLDGEWELTEAQKEAVKKEKFVKQSAEQKSSADKTSGS